jgi:hypothetical protein
MATIWQNMHGDSLELDVRKNNHSEIVIESKVLQWNPDDVYDLQRMSSFTLTLSRDEALELLEKITAAIIKPTKVPTRPKNTKFVFPKQNRYPDERPYDKHALD